MIGMGTALVSSIVLVCRSRPDDAPLATCRVFVAALKAELPTAFVHLQVGNIAPEFDADTRWAFVRLARPEAQEVSFDDRDSEGAT